MHISVIIIRRRTRHARRILNSCLRWARNVATTFEFIFPLLFLLFIIIIICRFIYLCIWLSYRTEPVHGAGYNGAREMVWNGGRATINYVFICAWFRLLFIVGKSSDSYLHNNEFALLLFRPLQQVLTFSAPTLWFTVKTESRTHTQLAIMCFFSSVFFIQFAAQRRLK